MGVTRIKIKIFNPIQPDLNQEVEVLVDSGSLYSALPRPLLERLGIRPLERRRFGAFGGARVDRDTAGIGVEYGGHRAAAPVIFGEPGDELILGVIALESLGYKLNPVTMELEPVELLML